MTNREEIDMCLNCKRSDCDGDCELVRPKRRFIMMFCAFGEIKTAKEWQEWSGIPSRVLYNRMKKLGLDMERAILMGKARLREQPCAFGVCRSMAEWSRITGIPTWALWDRVRKQGLTLEEAISSGKQRRKRRARNEEVSQMTAKRGTNT